jgi:hypothetical protein
MDNVRSSRILKSFSERAIFYVIQISLDALWRTRQSWCARLLESHRSAGALPTIKCNLPSAHFPTSAGTQNADQLHSYRP